MQTTLGSARLSGFAGTLASMAIDGDRDQPSPLSSARRKPTRSMSYDDNGPRATGASSAAELPPPSPATMENDAELNEELASFDRACTERVVQAEQQLNVLMQEWLEHLIEKPLRPSAPLTAETWVNAAVSVREAFEQVRIAVAQALSEIGDAEMHTRRRSLKGQANWYKLKLITARKASTMALEQQAIRLEAQLREDSRLGIGANWREHVTAAQEEVALLKGEAQELTAALRNALQSLDPQLDAQKLENRTAAETAQSVLEAASAMRAERDRLVVECRQLRKDGRQQLIDQLATARSAAAKAEAEVASAHVKLGRFDELELECKRCQAEMADCEAALRDAFAQLGLKAQAEQSVVPGVPALGTEPAPNMQEHRCLGVSSQASSPVSSSEPRSLGERLRGFLQTSLGTRQADKSRIAALEAVVAERRDAIELRRELDTARAETRDLQALLEKAANHHATVRREHGEMKERLEQHDARYSAAHESLEKAANDLKDWQQRFHALEVASRQEREALIKAAVESLQQLRIHLVETLSGLREKRPTEPIVEASPPKQPSLKTEPGLDGFAWNPHKHRWGVTCGAAGGAFDTVVVRLELPGHSRSHSGHGAPVRLAQNATATMARHHIRARPMSALTLSRVPFNDLSPLGALPEHTHVLQVDLAGAGQILRPHSAVSPAPPGGGACTAPMTALMGSPRRRNRAISAEVACSATGHGGVHSPAGVNAAHGGTTSTPSPRHLLRMEPEDRVPPPPTAHAHAHHARHIL